MSPHSRAASVRPFLRPVAVIGISLVCAWSAWSDPAIPTRGRTPVRPLVEEQQGGRVERGLVAYFPFLVGAGETAPDRGPVPGRLDLTFAGGAEWIGERNGVRFPESGGLARREAQDLRQALASTHELTVEVWLKAAFAEQGGPARIVTFSENPWTRNFMLGVEGGEVRFEMV